MVSMQPSIKQYMTLTGRFEPKALQNWMAHRALILDIDVQFISTSGTSIELEAKGHPILVEAFELACSLGPCDALINNINARSSDNIGP